MTHTKPSHNPSAFSMDLYLKELRKNNLAVWRESETRWQPISAAATPVKIAKIEWTELAEDARHILAAFQPLHTWLQHSEQKPLYHLLYDSLSPLEQQGAGLAAAKNWGHATIRFDLFWHNDVLKVIEANCTIPAMQAYSDIIRNAWLQAGGITTCEQISNSDELLQSLLSLYRRDSETKSPRTLAILHRPGDSQLAELQHHEITWQRTLPGTKVFRIHPSDIRSKDGTLIDARNEQPIDLVYRHCFGWRLADHIVLAHSLLNNKASRIYNPLSAHFEVKAFLALLSHISQDSRSASTIGLSSDQIRAIQKRVPKTRIVSQHLPHRFLQDIGISDDVIDKNIEDFVIKKSLGYGGHQVIMGSEWYHPDTQDRLTAIIQGQRSASQAPITPGYFLNWLRKQPHDLWIIQDRMTGRRHQTKVLQGDNTISEINGFVDASIFLNSGSSFLTSGGVSRIATGPVVNIGTGGGLVPLLIE